MSAAPEYSGALLAIDDAIFFAPHGSVAKDRLAEARRDVSALMMMASNVVWKLSHNDTEGPAKIDRDDVVIRQLVEALNKARGEA